MPWQNGRHFAGDILNAFFVNEKYSILFKIPLSCVLWDPNDNTSAIIKVRASHLTSDYLNKYYIFYLRIYASFCLGELIPSSLMCHWIVWLVQVMARRLHGTELSAEANADMMTSSNGNIFRVTGHLCGEFTGPRWIPPTKASDAELWCFFDLHPNKRLSKQWWGWWFEIDATVPITTSP